MRLIFTLLSLAVLPSCLSPSAQVCADGRICPGALRCDDAHGSCASDEQFVACEGLNALDACLADGLEGYCDLGVCIVDRCGDSVAGPSEACDDGNQVSGDGCRADCLSDETCGNGVTDVEAGEQCDCGTTDGVSPDCLAPNSDIAGASCRSDCLSHCGDGIINDAEDCDGSAATSECRDFGFDRGSLACSTDNCTHSFANCGDIGWELHEIPHFLESFNSVWRADSGEIFSTGIISFNEGGVVSHFDGLVWNTVLTDEPMFAVWGRAADDVYAVGDGGLILHFDGNEWSPMASMTGNPLRGVWGNDDQVFAAGLTTLLRNDGNGWVSDRAAGDLTTITSFTAMGGSGDLVYAHGLRDLGDGAGFSLPTTYRRTGDQMWFPVATETFHAIGGGGSDVFAVGAAGRVFRASGNNWIQMTTPPAFALRSVSGTSESNVFAAGDSGTVLHYDGTGWTELETGTNEQLRVTTAMGQPAFAVSPQTNGFEFSGSAFSPFFNGDSQGYQQLLGVSREELYLVGAGGIDRHDGRSFIDEHDGLVRGVSARSSDEIFAVSGTSVLLRDRGTWAPMSPSPPTVGELTSIWAAPDSIYVGSSGGEMFRWDGASWSDMSPPTDLPIVELGGAGDVVFAAVFPLVGSMPESTVYRFDGVSWSADLVAPGRLAIDVIDETDVIGVGNIGDIHRYNGTEWITERVGVSTFVDVSAVTATDVFAITFTGMLYHYDGNGWARMNGPAPTFPRIHARVSGLDSSGFGGVISRMYRDRPWP